MSKLKLSSVITNSTSRIYITSRAGFSKASIFIKNHKISSIAIGVAVVASVATISLAAITSGNEPVAMAPAVSKPAKITTNDQQQTGAVESASTTTTAASTPSSATNVATQQTKPQAGQKTTTSTSSTGQATQQTPTPTPTPRPTTQASFHIEIRDTQAYTQDFMGTKQLVVPFDIIMDSGFVANSYEQPFVAL